MDNSKTMSCICTCVHTYWLTCRALYFSINHTLVLHMFVCTCNECCGKENHQMAITRLVTKCTVRRETLEGSNIGEFGEKPSIHQFLNHQCFPI